MDRPVTQPKWITSPTWGPLPPCKRPLVSLITDRKELRLAFWPQFKLNGAIHRINHYLADKYLGSQLRYPLDRDIHLLNNWGLGSMYLCAVWCWVSLVSCRSHRLSPYLEESSSRNLVFWVRDIYTIAESDVFAFAEVILPEKSRSSLKTKEMFATENVQFSQLLPLKRTLHYSCK